MANELFNRGASLTVGKVKGSGKKYAGFRITFEVEKTCEGTPNPGKITIYNLAKASRAELEATGLIMVLDVGYAGIGQGAPILSQLFVGDVKRVQTIRQGADVVTTLEAGDSEVAIKTVHVEQSFAEFTPAQSIISTLASKLGVAVGNIVPGVSALFQNGFAMSGLASDNLDSLTSKLGHRRRAQRPRPGAPDRRAGRTREQGHRPHWHAVQARGGDRVHEPAQPGDQAGARRVARERSTHRRVSRSQMPVQGRHTWRRMGRRSGGDLMAAANETPSMAHVIRQAIESRLADVHTAMPATIESYDAATGMAAVAPCLKRKYAASGELVDLPVISNVPVLFPRGGGAAITFPLVKGDVVLLVFAERSVDAWKTEGGKVDPQDTRKHALSDAFAIPGGYPKANPPSACTITAAFTSTGLVVTNAIGNFTFEDNADVSFDTGTVQGLFGNGGKVSFTNALGELIAAISATMDGIMASMVATSMGLQPLIPDAAYATEKAKLDSFKA